MIVLAVLAIAAGVLSGGGAKAVLVPAAGGMLLLFIGVAMISSRLVAPLILVVGLPARRLGGSMGRLASANSGRNPSRTAATAAALMIGLALVTFVAVLASGLETSTKDDLTRQVTSDYVVVPDTSTSATYFDAATGPRSRRPPASRASRRSGPTTHACSGHRPRQRHRRRHHRRRLSLRVEGRLRRRAHPPRQRRDRRLQVGEDAQADPSAAPPAAGVERHQADVRRPRHLPPEVPGRLRRDPGRSLALRPDVPEPAERLRVRDVASGASPSATAALAKSLRPFSDVTVQSTPGWIKTQLNDIKTTLDVFYAFLALSVIVSLFGMVNTLVLSVFERTREIGMLRAVGVSRRQLRRMIRHESVITALIGAALGLPLGVLLAAILTRALASQGLSFHVPFMQLVAFTAVAVLAGILAAALPARRASRLNVLEALQYE